MKKLSEIKDLDKALSIPTNKKYMVIMFVECVGSPLHLKNTIWTTSNNIKTIERKFKSYLKKGEKVQLVENDSFK